MYIKLLPPTNPAKQCLEVLIYHGLDELYLWLYSPIHPPVLHPISNLRDYHNYACLLHPPLQSTSGLRRACCCSHSTLSSRPRNPQAVSTAHEVFLEFWYCSSSTTKTAQQWRKWSFRWFHHPRSKRCQLRAEPEYWPTTGFRRRRRLAARCSF